MDRDKKRRFEPTLDRLDSRRLMAAHLAASLAHGVLSVDGTAGADVISVDIQGGQRGVITVAGVHKAFRASKVQSIEVHGGAGDDSISVRTPGWPKIAVRIDAGRGVRVINGVPESPPPAPPAGVEPVIGLPRPAASAPPRTPSLPSAAMRIIGSTNAQRVLAGLAPLGVSASLMQAAEIQSGNMARLGIMSHTLPGTAEPSLTDRAAAAGYRYATLGENIAFNYAEADVVAGWMGSPGHRANILNADFTEVGVGVAFDVSGEPYYTQVFGRPA